MLPAGVSAVSTPRCRWGRLDGPGTACATIVSGHVPLTGGGRTSGAPPRGAAKSCRQPTPWQCRHHASSSRGDVQLLPVGCIAVSILQGSSQIAAGQQRRIVSRVRACSCRITSTQPAAACRIAAAAAEAAGGTANCPRAALFFAITMPAVKHRGAFRPLKLSYKQAFQRLAPGEPPAPTHLRSFPASWRGRAGWSGCWWRRPASATRRPVVQAGVPAGGD